MYERVRVISENIRYIAGLGEKPPVTHMNSDAVWLARYRVGRDIVRTGGECLGDGSCPMCDYYFEPDEPRMCERYAKLGSALAEHAAISVTDLPEGTLCDPRTAS